MTEFFQKHKKSVIICGTVIAVAVFAFYLCELFRPGYWYGSTFLYEKGYPYSMVQFFSGNDTKNGADYELTMTKDGKTVYMVFTVNETERSYEITSDNSENHKPAVTIVENGELVFSGTYGGYYLENENGEPFEPLITMHTDSYKPTEAELFPSYNWLYRVSQSEKTETRGETFWLIPIVLLAAVTAIDMIYQDLFWEMKHFLDVSGGEPSEFYRFVQKIGWIVSPMLIGFIMFMSFAKG